MNWIHRVNIKRFLGEGTDKASIQKAYDGITKELRQVPLPLPPEWHRYAKLAVREEDVNLFNLGMSALYDWADQNRVWMGAL